MPDTSAISEIGRKVFRSLLITRGAKISQIATGTSLKELYPFHSYFIYFLQQKKKYKIKSKKSVLGAPWTDSDDFWTQKTCVCSSI